MKKTIPAKTLKTIKRMVDAEIGAQMRDLVTARKDIAEALFNPKTGELEWTINALKGTKGRILEELEDGGFHVLFDGAERSTDVDAAQIKRL